MGSLKRVSVVFAVCAFGFVAYGCGGDDATSDERDQSEQPQQEIYSMDTVSPVESCGDGVQVGPHTTCSFAGQVATEYEKNPGASTIEAFSATAGRDFTLNCEPWDEGGTICTSDTGAAIFLP